MPPLAARVWEYAVPRVAPGSGAAVVMLRVGLLDVIVRLNALYALFLAASVTCTVKLNEPVAVGVPERVPLAAFSEMLAGRAPAVTAQVYGAVPPVAASVCEYELPATPPGSAVPVVMLKGSALGAIVMANCLLAVAWLVSATCTLKVNGPVAERLPDRTPVEAFSESPDGSVPDETDHI